MFEDIAETDEARYARITDRKAEIKRFRDACACELHRRDLQEHHYDIWPDISPEEAAKVRAKAGIEHEPAMPPRPLCEQAGLWMTETGARRVTW